MSRLQLPEGFFWGVSSSAFQIEGSANEGGRASSVWDSFCVQPGVIQDGSDARKACEHYQLWPEDLDRMERLGLKQYRMSLAWPRILPRGYGQVNSEGLGYYDRLLDGLLERDIEPWVCLSHWDLPSSLAYRGGWPARDTAQAFAEYAQLMARRYGDRVKHWITLHDPASVAFLGHREGVHAPGVKNSMDAWAAAHHQLLAHGLGTRAMRSERSQLAIGLSLKLWPTKRQPERQEEAYFRDLERHHFFLNALQNGIHSGDTLDWIRRECASRELPFLQSDDSLVLQTPGDFLVWQIPSPPPASPPRREGETKKARAPLHEIWLNPEEQLKILHKTYPHERLILSLDGFAEANTPGEDGFISDTKRLHYLRTRIDGVQEAAADGLPLSGCFLSPLLDQFEWHRGYAQPKGLVAVDRETQARKLKDSAYWLRQLLREDRVDGPLNRM